MEMEEEETEKEKECVCVERYMQSVERAIRIQSNTDWNEID